MGLKKASLSILKVSIKGNTVILTGTVPGQLITVYNLYGQTIVQMTALASSTSFTLPQKGIYLIKTTNQVQKLAF
jgi:hypothetical protein